MAGMVLKWFDSSSSSLNSTINRKCQTLSSVSLGIWCSVEPFAFSLWLLNCLSFLLRVSSFSLPRTSSETRDLTNALELSFMVHLSEGQACLSPHVSRDKCVCVGGVVMGVKMSLIHLFFFTLPNFQSYIFELGNCRDHADAAI